MDGVSQAKAAGQQRLTDAAGYAVVSVDPHGCITLLNAEAEELTGWVDHHARGKPLDQVLLYSSARVGTRYTDLAALALRGGDVAELTDLAVVNARDGQQRRVSGKACPMRDAAGNVTGMVLLFRDADHARRVRTALHESEVLTRNINLHLQSGMVYQVLRPPDGSRRFTYVSDSVRQLYGISPQQAIANPELVYGRVHPEDRERLWRVEEEAHRDLKTLRVEARIVEPSGRIRWSSFVATPRRLSDGTSCWDGMEFDITERKQVEAALRENEERFRAIFNASFQFTGLLTPEGVLIEANQTALDFAGVTAADVIGKPFWEAPWWRGDEARVRRLQEAIRRAANGELVRYETEVRGAGDTLTTIDFRLKPVFVRDGTVKLLVPEGHDVGERLRAERDRLSMQEQLARVQRMESLGQLAGGVAHGFNNMLSVILGNTELAMERPDLPASLRTELEYVRDAAQHSANLTRQLLTFARRQTAAPKVMDLHQAVAETLGMLRLLIGEGVDLAWKPAAAATRVLLDADQLKQVLTNLLVNACDAIGGAGRIVIETGNLTLAADQCAGHPGALPGEYVTLAVSDHGCGMDAATLARIFEPFFTTKEAGRGTGIGLAVVYGIVTQNHGFVDVRSEVGKGSSFRICLPCHPDDDEPGALATGAPTAAGGHETILLVEDEQELLRVSRRMLGTLGYTVLAAGTPDEAVRLAGEHAGRIHLLVTDVVMPGMNGRDLAAHLQARHPHMKVLYVSGYTANVIAGQDMLAAGLHFLQKPFSKQELAAKVREALESLPPAP
jgi:PAS domain S-box-containing protein